LDGSEAVGDSWAGDPLAGHCGVGGNTDGLWVNAGLDQLVLVKLNVPVVVGTLWNILGVCAFAVITVFSNVEDGPQGTPVLSGSAGDAHKILSAVSWVSVLGEDSGPGLRADKLAIVLSFGCLLLLALPHLVSPFAHAVCGVEGQTGGAAVSVSQPVSAVVEGGAIVFGREGSVEPRAVGSRDGRLQLRAVPTLDVVGVLAVFSGESRVRVVKSQAVSAQLLFGYALQTLPVAVAAVEVRVVALELIGAAEVVYKLAS